MNIPLGTHSKIINFDVIQSLEEAGCDPIKILADAAKGMMTYKDENGVETNVMVDPEKRISAAKELASYLFPKKRSLDMSAVTKASVTYNIVNFSEVMPDQSALLEQQVKDMALNVPRTRAEMKMVVNASRKEQTSAVVIEAMRSDVERLVVDDSGMATYE